VDHSRREDESWTDIFKEITRDHTRDDFCDGLRSLGIAADLAPRGRPEESIRSHRGQESLGLIEIRSGSIAWVNIWREKSEDGSDYYADYSIPDARLRDGDVAGIRLRSVWIRDVPIVGPIKGTRWKGDGPGRRIAAWLNTLNVAADHRPASGEPPVSVWAHLGHWIMTVHISVSFGLLSWILAPRLLPTEEGWRFYQDVAAALLEVDLAPRSAH
jgi:hypothetical protein